MFISVKFYGLFIRNLNAFLFPLLFVLLKCYHEIEKNACFYLKLQLILNKITFSV